jgi:hypothetical protein
LTGRIVSGTTRLRSPRLAVLSRLVSPSHRQHPDRAASRIAATLGGDRLAALQAAGQTCSKDEIVSLALAAIDHYNATNADFEDR